MIPDSNMVARLRAAGCVFAEDEARLLIDAAATSDELESMVEQRIAGLPLEQVLGWAEFCRRRIAMDPGVFVPRRRTEFLVAEAAKAISPGATVVDLCCGSGAIGVALVAAVGPIDLYASDLDPAAVACARRNVGGTGSVIEGDLYAPLPAELRGRVDLIVACAPYVPTESIAMMPPEARDHEPGLALDGGVDGLDIVRRIAAEAPEWLAPAGCLFIETSESQALDAVDAFERVGMCARFKTNPDTATCIHAQRP